jgi:membrane-bound lytic murein transglycosylase C
VRLALGLLLAALSHGQDFSELDRESKEAGSQSEDYGSMRDDMRRQMAEQSREQAREVERLSTEMERQYADLQRKMAEETAALRKRVLRQWTEFHDSTPKEWVDYGKSGDTMSRVDYEKGKIEVEVLVPAEDAQGDRAKKAAEKKVAEQLRNALSETPDQVKTPKGEAVTPDKAEKFVHEALVPQMKVSPKPVVAEDGKKRVKVTVVVPLVPDHIAIRAKKQEARVLAAAEKYDLDPALVFAVMHTESEFNPRAKSQAPAFGLMQLMPKTAAREAYQFLYKQEKILDPEYLYDPDHNVLLGATYLHMLQARHFKKIKSADNRRLLSIAAYNCGPGCVSKYVVKGRDVDAMTSKELAAVIAKTVPRETQLYVPRVEGRMALYKTK